MRSTSTAVNRGVSFVGRPPGRAGASFAACVRVVGLIEIGHPRTTWMIYRIARSVYSGLRGSQAHSWLKLSTAPDLRSFFRRRHVDLQFSLQRSAERGQVAVAHDLPQARFDVQERGGQPTVALARVLPVVTFAQRSSTSALSTRVPFGNPGWDLAEHDMCRRRPRPHQPGPIETLLGWQPGRLGRGMW